MIKENRGEGLFIHQMLLYRIKINLWSLKVINLGKNSLHKFYKLSKFLKFVTLERQFRFLKISSFQRFFTNLWKRNS